MGDHTGLYGLGYTGDSMSLPSDRFWARAKVEGENIIANLIPAFRDNDRAPSRGGRAGGGGDVGREALHEKLFLDALFRKQEIKTASAACQTEGDASASPAWERYLMVLKWYVHGDCCIVC